jgi:hypothetical protein
VRLVLDIFNLLFVGILLVCVRAIVCHPVIFRHDWLIFKKFGMKFMKKSVFYVNNY